MTVAAVDLPKPRRLLVLDQPLTRADCATVPRPCPFRSCRHNLTTERGWRPDRLSCSLDAADTGGLTLDEIGELFGLSRERIRQIQKQAVENLAEAMRQRGLLTSREAWRVPDAVQEAISP
jgi:hypothetical protein